MSGFPLFGAIATYNGGGDCIGLGGYFGLSGDASILLGLLPPIVHLSKESDRMAMRWSLERMMEELRDPQPGGSLVAQQLAYTMLVQALRLYLAERANKSVGWLYALADPQMSKAMSCIHGEPARRWTLQDLAECAGMSRSGFALRFKDVVGTPPMEYLTHWRMLLAADKLTNSEDSLAEIAASIGYESESTFSIAFKRTMGCPPRHYSRSGNPRFLTADDRQPTDVQSLVDNMR
jgi:AraC-like DNA-binding protein